MHPAMTDPTYDPFMSMPTIRQLCTIRLKLQFLDNLKGEIFSEIMIYGDGTASEIASDLMMNAGGNSAMFMMENVMQDNPEMMAQVMDNFMHQEFDIFYHMEAPTDTMMMTAEFDPMT